MLQLCHLPIYHLLSHHLWLCWYITLYFHHKEHICITILCCSPNVAKYTIHTTVMSWSWQSWFICIFHYCNRRCCLQFYFTRVNNIFAMLKNFMKCTMQVFFWLIIFIDFYHIFDEWFQLVVCSVCCVMCIGLHPSSDTIDFTWKVMIVVWNSLHLFWAMKWLFQKAQDELNIM